MSFEITVQIKYKNSDGETVFVRREAEVHNKREAKDVFKATYHTYKSENEAQVELAEKEAQWDYDNCMDEAGIPRWL